MTAFSVMHGGPWHRLADRLHVNFAMLALALWLPSVIPAAIASLRAGHLDPLLTDPAVHARFLIAIPLVLLAERSLERRCKSSVHELRAGRFATRTEIDNILDAATRMRDKSAVETALAVVAFGLGQASLWGLLPSGFLHDLARGNTSFGRVWYAALALPLLQFLWARWLWHWFIWCYVLVRLSRLRLAVTALHPDRAAGLGFLDEPTDAFAVFAASMVCVASAGWIVEVRTGTTLAQLAPTAIGFLVLALVLAFAPLALFAGHLYRALRRDQPIHRHLALSYVREFRHKWLRHGHPDEALLGTSDLQSLHDLGGAFETTSDTHVWPVERRSLITVAAAVILPLLPVVLASMPIEVVFTRVGKALLPF